jgi:hypothetical protein
MYLSETYSKVRIGKHLSDTFSIQNGLLIINFALEYVISKVHVGMKLNGAHQHLYVLMTLIYWAVI